MKEKIVLGAWEMVTEYPSLKKMNFLPSLFGVLWLFLILIYQITYTYVLIFEDENQTITMLKELLSGQYFIPGVIAIVVIFVLYLITNPIARGGIIHMIDTYRKNNGTKYHHSWQGLFDGFSHFLPIFEVQNIIGIFSPLTIVTSYFFLLRFFGGEYFTPISIIMGVYLFFAFFLNMCFSYAPFFIIFDKKTGVQSLSASTGMAVRNISITAQLYFTNLLLYLRVILAGAIFLLIPLVVSAVLAWFSITSFAVFMVIFLFLAFILFLFIVHLNSSLDIFILALWYEAYRACKEEDALLEEKDESEHTNKSPHH